MTLLKNLKALAVGILIMLFLLAIVADVVIVADKFPAIFFNIFGSIIFLVLAWFIGVFILEY